MAEEITDVDLEVRQERDLSWMVYAGDDDEDGKEKWVSLAKVHCENNGDGTFTMPVWLATEKGLV